MSKKITNLKINNKNINKDNLTLKIGAMLGATTAMTIPVLINKTFPNIIQTYGTLAAASLPISTTSKIAIATFLGSAPVDFAAPIIITGIGAGIGSLAGQTVKIVKKTLKNKKQLTKKTN